MKTTEMIQDFAKRLGLKQSNLYFERDSGGCLTCPQGILPVEFLALAEDALARGPDGLVDAVANAQRAARAQVKYALGCLGLEAKRRKIKQQMEVLSQVGMLAPRLLRKISAPRNLMEHQYRRPSEEEAEDAVDIASLFVEATNRVLQNFEEMFSFDQKVGKKYQHKFMFWFKESKVYSITLVEGPDHSHVIELPADDPLFVPIHKFAVALSREVIGHQDPKVSEAFFELLSSMGIPE